MSLSDYVDPVEVDEYSDIIDNAANDGEEFIIECAHVFAWKLAFMYKVDGTATYQQAHMAAVMVQYLERAHRRFEPDEIWN